MTAFFESLPLLLNLALFAALAAVICLAGARLSYLVDTIAERTHMARAMAGLIFLATATELPEVVTSITAATAGNPELVLNNMFGGIAMQTAILAVADMCVAHHALTSLCKTPAPVLQGLFLMAGLAILLGLSVTGDFPLVAHLGGASLFVALLYISSIVFIRKYSGAQAWNPTDVPNPPASAAGESYRETYARYSLRRAIAASLGASALILVCGVSMTYAAEALAGQTGLGDSFVGVALLAGSTSLPELSTSIAAVRIGAPSMAIANILGSNMIMIFLLFPADLAYAEGLLLDEIGTSAALALASGILVTAIYCIGLVTRPRRVFFGRLGPDSALVFAIYAASLAVFYVFRGA